MDDDDKFVPAIFCFVTSDHVSRIIGAPFEMVASIVPLDLFGLKYAEHVTLWGNSFNKMSREGRVIEAIGQNIAKWIVSPTDEHLKKLASLYKICCEHA